MLEYSWIVGASNNIDFVDSVLVKNYLGKRPKEVTNNPRCVHDVDTVSSRSIARL